jgi:CDP-4-dehydro-6-deoxyglucose reductase
LPKITLPSGKSFDADPSESLLDAALRAGLPLPYSCRTGRCSTCRCRVAAGRTSALHAELGLSAEELAQGWVLGCVRSAVTDATLDIEELGVALPAQRTLACRIQAIARLSDDVVQVKLRLPPTAAFDYLPGQYIDVIGPDAIRRSYSIANAPAADRLLELHVRRVDGGSLSRYWFERAQANDLLRLHGPLGTFFLRDVAGLALAFLATGTGLAPVKAILQGLASLPVDARPASVTVYWGGRVEADHYQGADELPPGVRLVRVLSRADAGWAGARGHVQNAFLADAPDLARSAVYACGSDAMIHAAHAQLVAAGLPDRRFSSDAFVRSGAI